MRQCGITPIIYTEGTAAGNYRKGLQNAEVAHRLYELGATVVLKVNSLHNAEYQNRVVFGGDRERKKPLNLDYFDVRNQALAVLMDVGFNDHDPTRLGFDTIICRENYGEIMAIHKFVRENNIFVLFVNYLPSGRCTNSVQNAITRDEEHAIFRAMADFDLERFGLTHASHYPYARAIAYADVVNTEQKSFTVKQL